MLSAMAQFSPSSYYSDILRGYQYYEFIEKADRDFDSMKEMLAENLKRTAALIFTKENLTVSFTAEDDGLELLQKPMTEFVAKLARLQEKDAVRTFRPVKEKTAYTSSS